MSPPEAARFPRQHPAGFRTLIKLAAKSPRSVHVVCEATGKYHLPLVGALQQAGIVVSVVNPRRTHSFAQSRGQQAKTDKMDALLLADFGETMKPLPTPAPDTVMVELDELVSRRSQLVADWAREKNRQESATGTGVLASIKSHLRFLDEEVKALLKQSRCWYGTRRF